jgi:hypothetical protein
LRYFGATDFAQGVWAGIELDENSGKNDGSVLGKRYFKCNAMYGLFVPENRISAIKGAATNATAQPSTSTSLNSIHKQPTYFKASNLGGALDKQLVQTAGLSGIRFYFKEFFDMLKKLNF